MKRTTEFVLGLIGGIFGIFSATAVLFIGSIGEAFFDDPSVTNHGWIAILASIAAIIGSVLVKSKAKAGGWTMVISALVGLYAVGFFYILSGILLLIGGLMGAFRKPKRA
jgi:hypothetical protein